MRTRESGMPEQALWEQFFDPDAILDRLGLGPESGDVVDFGCGYGTFTLAAARRVRGLVHAIDIDQEMVRTAAARARAAGLENVRAVRRDFIEAGTGLDDAAAGTVFLFNNLHAESWRTMLTEAGRVLRVGGTLAIIHWNHDPQTPRGPSMAIRLTPDDCCERAAAAGFLPMPPGVIDLPPHHFGLVLSRPATASASDSRTPPPDSIR
ncbi:MAG: class I SAM-dependent methyltransferase [Planctomycetota bacterium]|jgi:SAM-dependent methyltransferase